MNKIIFLLVAIIGSIVLSCSDNYRQSDGSFSLAAGSMVLKFDSELTFISRLIINISGNDFDSMNLEYSPIDISRPIRIDSIPVGEGRSILIDGYDGETLTVTGETTNVAIYENQITEITIILHYANGENLEARGGINISLGLNEVPEIRAILFNPSPVFVNESVKFLVITHDGDGDDLIYNWSADHGTFNDSESANPSWISPLYEGDVTFNIVISDGIDLFSYSFVINVAPSSVALREPERGELLINEFLFDPPDDLTGDANEDGTRDSYDDEFVEIVNISNVDLLLDNTVINDSTSARHLFAGGTILKKNQSIVVFGGGTPVDLPYDFQIASTGSLSLSNSGDTISIFESDTLIDSVGYDDNLGNNQSVTRFPDLIGDFADHFTVTNGISYFSPGKRTGGELF